MDLLVATDAVHEIDLATMRACEVFKSYRNGKGEQRDAVLERVELCLLPRDRNKTGTRLELYRNGQGPLLNGELQFADQWAALIESRLRNS
jgi:hypothetical protein